MTLLEYLGLYTSLDMLLVPIKIHEEAFLKGIFTNLKPAGTSKTTAPV
jgi:hypothetical protein